MSMNSQSVISKVKSAGLFQTQGLIGGKWTDAYDGKTIELCDPSTGDVIANVACMGKRETSDAVSSAYETYKSWSKVTATERSKRLRKWYDLLIDHREELGKLITLEQGKPLKEAIGEVSYGTSFIEFYAEQAKRVYGDISPPTLTDRRILVLKQVSLELGGHAPCIVFDDADLDVAVKGSVSHNVTGIAIVDFHPIYGENMQRIS